MIPSRHPDEALLVDYAAGALSPVARLAVAIHIGACAYCRRLTTEAESVGGVLLEDLQPAPMQSDALSLALARIDRPAPPPPKAPPHPPGWIATPRVVREAAKSRRRFVAPGVWVADVMRGPGPELAYLLGMAPGTTVPLHTHRGFEMVCVLDGAYADGGEIHRTGDFSLNESELVHTPKVTRDGDCVCLISAADRLVALDWIGRLFQPIARI